MVSLLGDIYFFVFLGSMFDREISRIWNSTTILAIFVWRDCIFYWYCLWLLAVTLAEMEFYNWSHNHLICCAIGKMFVENGFINHPIKFILHLPILGFHYVGNISIIKACHVVFGLVVEIYIVNLLLRFLYLSIVGFHSVENTLIINP